ncbi:hypothetical protein ACFFX0_29425 [Citricoccus parietis]|uniref:Uncharacterized protein n=1 Tax=Citricoccus parietis TaxID=592307 RepID=A0ABV5G7Z7_9MICC
MLFRGREGGHQQTIGPQHPLPHGGVLFCFPGRVCRPCLGALQLDLQ